MDIILKKDIEGLGYKDDTIKVKPGYGRNYLIPQGLAILANNSNRKRIEEEVKQAAHKAAKLKNDAENIAEKIGDMVLNIPAKAGESGKIFGAITTHQVADALKNEGFDVERRKISFKTDIKNVGEYTAVIDLHKDVKKEITINVVAE
jgi:large subunit ribosomal protein L9